MRAGIAYHERGRALIDNRLEANVTPAARAQAAPEPWPRMALLLLDHNVSQEYVGRLSPRGHRAAAAG